MRKEDEQAFPWSETYMRSEPGAPNYKKPHTVTHRGMTLRDYFAAKAMEGCVEKAFSDVLLARCNNDTHEVSRLIAAASYQIADAMLKEREISNEL